jgi:hypothetical protein
MKKKDLIKYINESLEEFLPNRIKPRGGVPPLTLYFLMSSEWSHAQVKIV